MTDAFDFDKVLEALRSGKDLTGKDGVLTPLIKQLTEAALSAELDQHFTQDTQPNRRNGRSRKTVKAAISSFELETPRDRAWTFEPGLVKKNQTKLTDEINRKILSMFALGMSYRDIRGHVQDIDGLDVSETVISGVTDRLIPEIKSWQQRPLEAIYPINRGVKDILIACVDGLTGFP